MYSKEDTTSTYCLKLSQIMLQILDGNIAFLSSLWGLKATYSVHLRLVVDFLFVLG